MGRPRSFYQGYNPYCDESWKCCTPAPCVSGACCWIPGCQNCGNCDSLCSYATDFECMVFGGNFIPDIGCVGSGLDEIRPTNNKPSPNSQVWIQPYGSGCGGIYTCFTSGSLVLTPTGNKSIEEIQVGDTVSTLDGDKKVHALENPCLGDRRLISINNSKFFFTEDHPIKTTEGFKAANYEMCNNNYSYIDLVGELSVGDCVVSKDGYETIKDIEF